MKNFSLILPFILVSACSHNSTRGVAGASDSPLTNKSSIDRQGDDIQIYLRDTDANNLAWRLDELNYQKLTGSNLYGAELKKDATLYCQSDDSYTTPHLCIIKFPAKK